MIIKSGTQKIGHSSDIRHGQYFENCLDYLYWNGKTIIRTANKTALFCYCKLPIM